jgi:pimeloyl-ACP methyl ester carboxylesterase
MTTLPTAAKRRASRLSGHEARARLLSGLPVSERRLALSGVSTSVLEGGGGSPVVLLHGPAGYAAHWMGLIPGLVATHRVVAPDLPGHGASEIRDGRLDEGRMLDWLDALIERTCTVPPVVVGALAGGAIAMRFAIERGARVRRLVLIDTFGLAPLEPAPEMAQALQAFLARPDPDTHERLWQFCAFDLKRLQQREGARWQPFEAYTLDRARTPSVQQAVGRVLELFAFPPIPPADLARLALPVDLVWGRHDRATPLAVAEAAGRRYGWPLHVIEDSNDDPAVEQPQAVLRALTAALA